MIGRGKESPEGQVPKLKKAAWLANFFDFSSRGTGLRTEVLAGISTFLALSYIVVVNPTILANTGMPWNAAFFATVLVAGIGTIVMGLWARLPFAMAPGMEMNAYLAFFVVGTVGFSWPEALGVVFWSGLVFLIASASGLRAKVLQSIPPFMKASLSLSVGIFIAMISLSISGLVQSEDLVITGVGQVWTTESLSLALGLVAILVFSWLGWPGGVLVSVIAMAVMLHLFSAAGVSAPEISESESFFSAVAQLDLMVLLDPRAWSLILLLFLIDFYGSVAKLVGLTAKTNLATPDGLPGMKQALLTDSGATVLGATVGTSNVTVYVESGVGIASGGRSGLTAVVCGSCLLACLFLAPLIQYVPVAATTGALLFVAITLLPAREELKQWSLFELLTVAAMQLTVILTAAVDKALLVGALAVVLRSITKREWPNAYLAGTVVVLAMGYIFQVDPS